MATNLSSRPRYSAVALLLPAVQAAREAANSDSSRSSGSGAVAAYDLGSGTAEEIVGRVSRQGLPGGKPKEIVVVGSKIRDGRAGSSFIPEVGDEVLVAFEHGGRALIQALGPNPTVTFVGCGLTPSRVRPASLNGLAKRLGAVINCAEPGNAVGYRYHPNGSTRQLIGHELTHTLQQGDSGSSGGSNASVRGWNPVKKEDLVGRAPGT